ncbi:hypothetical protein SEA_EURATIS_36 [Streptomyces phage Euratis]|uniref:Uncharacterized protein n=1 Tax=Streptomyces phage Euratis TaxID=2510569 RepID=A0A411B121_9CAUD|nr:hypothetical protein SEA_EURATIS_36 [Streptomyces phage Euratis]
MFVEHDGPDLISPRRQESVTFTGCLRLPVRGRTLAVNRL